MNIIVAPDSFKGSLTALEAADALVQGVRAVLPEAEIVSIPLADGGEGTREVLGGAGCSEFPPPPGEGQGGGSCLPNGPTFCQ